jgi:hypothetical protein
MKKSIILLMLLTLVVSLAGCSKSEGSANETKNIEGDLTDILKEIYDTAELSDDFKQYTLDGLQTIDVNADNCEYYLGKKGLEYQEAIASSPLMTTTAYELDLVRVKEGADIEKIKTEIRDNVNPNKWICVGVDPKNVIVDSIGDLIVVILSDDNATALHDAFLKLKD